MGGEETAMERGMGGGGVGRMDRRWEGGWRGEATRESIAHGPTRSLLRRRLSGERRTANGALGHIAAGSLGRDPKDYGTRAPGVTDTASTLG